MTQTLATDTGYCVRCHLLVGLDGFHVVEVAEVDERQGWRGPFLRVMRESQPRLGACRSCGVVARSHGRRQVRLVDTPCLGRKTELVWRKRTWRCVEPFCPARSFTEQDARIASPRALHIARACTWAIRQLRREHASVAGLARQLGTAWRTVWESVKPLLQARAEDETRFEGVRTLGGDEHLWHHVSTTASSISTAASPEASATETTTAYACSSSVEDTTPSDPPEVRRARFGMAWPPA
ncbi:transposase family protein [Nocardioides insulae]|uniref:transposase family protein n=1 Tax=Nocardioides insulae TaxID=394734 RepID=UPI00068775AC|nr:transposase family protein [Nocardioides insulae]